MTFRQTVNKKLLDEYSKNPESLGRDQLLKVSGIYHDRAGKERDVERACEYLGLSAHSARRAGDEASARAYLLNAADLLEKAADRIINSPDRYSRSNDITWLLTKAKNYAGSSGDTRERDRLAQRRDICEKVDEKRAIIMAMREAPGNAGLKEALLQVDRELKKLT